MPSSPYSSAVYQGLGLTWDSLVVSGLTHGRGVCSKICLATVLIRSIFALEQMHERFSASAIFQRKIERINAVARHVLL